MINTDFIQVSNIKMKTATINEIENEKGERGALLSGVFFHGCEDEDPDWVHYYNESEPVKFMYNKETEEIIEFYNNVEKLSKTEINLMDIVQTELKKLSEENNNIRFWSGKQKEKHSIEYLTKTIKVLSKLNKKAENMRLKNAPF